MQILVCQTSCLMLDAQLAHLPGLFMHDVVCAEETRKCTCHRQADSKSGSSESRGAQCT